MKDPDTLVSGSFPCPDRMRPRSQGAAPPSHPLPGPWALGPQELSTYPCGVSDVAPGLPPEVVLLSHLVGRTVVTDGRELGRVRDLTSSLAPGHPPVTGLVVDVGHGTSRLLPWSSVRSLGGPGPVQVQGWPDLGEGPGPTPGLAPDATQLRLARDVVDTQVVDLQEYRLSRVSDLLLGRRADGALEVAAVDVGLGAVLRRMGLGLLARGLGPVLVDWQDLHLTSRRGHELQLTSSAAAFRRLDSHGVAELLTRLSTDRATELVTTLTPGHAAAALHHSHPATGRRLLGALSRADVDRLVRAARPTHAARLAELRRASSQPSRRLLRTAGWRRHPPSRAGANRSGRGAVGG